MTLYWQLVMRWEIGVFNVLLLLFMSGVGGVVVSAVELAILRRKGSSEEKNRRPSAGAWVRFLLYTTAIAVTMLLFMGGGRPVGGVVVFDEQGYPQRATMQRIVEAGGKMKVEHVVLHAMAPDGSTRALHRAGYGGGRKPMQRSSAFWDGESVRSTETLAVLASGPDVREAVADLQGVESKFVRVGSDVAVFLRRDGIEVPVELAEVVDEDSLGVAGCLVDVNHRRRVKAEGLIDPHSVSWATAGPGCPASPPAGAWIVVSDDAAFGDILPLLTLEEASGRRWQTALTTATGSDDPRLIGVVPFVEALTVVAADGDELIFSRLGWDDGVAIDIVRW